MDIDNPSLDVFALYNDKETLEKLEYYYKPIDALISFGTHILNAMRENANKNPDERDVIFVLFRRIIEMLDAASLQLTVGCTLPTTSNLRIILETVAQLEYLLIDPELRLIKCKYFRLMEFHADLVYFEKVINEPKLAAKKNEIHKQILTIKSILEDSGFDDVRDVYLKKTIDDKGKRIKNHPKWYSLNSNINSIAKLFEYLNKVDVYNIAYSPSSNVTHSSRLLFDTLYHKDDAMYIRRIRNLENLDEIANAIITLATDAIHLVYKSLPHSAMFGYLQAKDEFNRRFDFKIKSTLVN